MKAVSGRELGKIVGKHGWNLIRFEGSHHIYGRPGDRNRLSIPVHGNRPLKIGLQAFLMKSAGLSSEDLE